MHYLFALLWLNLSYIEFNEAKYISIKSDNRRLLNFVIIGKIKNGYNLI